MSNDLDFSKLSFSKQSIISVHKQLFSADKKIKAEANKFFSLFLVNTSAFDISFEILDDINEGVRSIGAMIFHKCTQAQMPMLIQDKEKFSSVFDKLLSNLLTKYKNSNFSIVELLCCSLALLITVGLYTNTFYEVIPESDQLAENEMVILFLLENYPKEIAKINPSNLPNDYIVSVRSKAAYSINSVKDFATTVLSKNCSSQQSTDQIDFFTRGINIVVGWTQLGLVIYNYQDLQSILLSSIKDNNVEKIEEMILGSILNSEEVIDQLSPFEEPEKLTILLSSISFRENFSYMCSITDIIYTVQPIIDSLKFNQSPNIYLAYTSIISATIEKFPFLIVHRNEAYTNSLKKLLLSLLNSEKILTSRLKQGIAAIKVFFFKYKSYVKKNKKDVEALTTYFNELLAIVISKCKLTTMDIKSKTVDDNVFEYKPLEVIEILNPEEYFENQQSNDLLSDDEYREHAGQIIADTLLILDFLSDEEDEFGNEFFQKVKQNLKEYDNQPNENSTKFAVENCLFMLKHGVDYLELTGQSVKPILDILFHVSQVFFDFGVTRLTKSYLELLLKVAPYIWSHSKLNDYVIWSLITYLNVNELEAISSKILYEISKYCENNSKNAQALYGILTSIYLKSGHKTVWLLVCTICKNSIELKSTDRVDDAAEDKFVKSLLRVFAHPVESNRKIFDYVSKLPENEQLTVKSTDFNEFKNLIIKNFYSMELILDLSRKYFSGRANLILSKLLINHNTKLMNHLLSNWSSDTTLVKYLFKLLISVVNVLRENSVEHFDFLHSVAQAGIALSSPRIYEPVELIQKLYDFAIKGADIKDRISKENKDIIYTTVSNNLLKLVVDVKSFKTSEKVVKGSTNPHFYPNQISLLLMQASENGIKFSESETISIETEIVSIVNFLSQSIINSSDELKRNVINCFNWLIQGDLMSVSIKNNIVSTVLATYISFLPSVEVTYLEAVRLYFIM